MSTHLPAAGLGRRLAAVALAAAALVPLGAGTAATASPRVGRAAESPTSRQRPDRDPATSVPPSQRFVGACRAVTRAVASQRACDRAALPDFDKVRAREGLSRMSLPTAFPRMSVPHQLLVLVNIERADRGRGTFSGASTRLDRYAAAGARAGGDPTFPSPFPGTFGGANWAGVGTSTLLADYVWMYDDGPGSPNRDCTSPGASGCWGHRRNILHAYAAPRAIGVAVARHGQSIAEEYIGGDHADHASGTRWSTLARTLPVGVSRTHPTVHAPVGGAGHVTLSVWASGEPMHVRARLTAAGGSWSMSRSSCRLAAGTSCRITVTVRPTNGATHRATVTLAGPHGDRLVHLVERPTR